MAIRFYNSLTRKRENFKPLKAGRVGVYCCGPTVYDFATIGNFRTYTTADLLVRFLRYAGFKVKYVMNFTDVGHLTGDNLGDADLGEDRVEKSAKRKGKTAWDIARFYSRAFLADFKKLNLARPFIFCRATDHIKEQIQLVKKLEKKGFAYEIKDGIYFDTLAFEKKTGQKYGRLSILDKIKAGGRVEPNPEKKNQRDFALWKFSQKPGQRQMEWPSPWGLGFPGWHIECSAMSMKYLGQTFDIHLGGEDLRSTHHPNEIAQSEAASGKPFVRYWLHGAFLLVDGGRMGKSLGNAYTLADIEKRGFSPLALRYLYLTAHYRDQLNFTWAGLKASQRALDKLYEKAADAKTQISRLRQSAGGQAKLKTASRASKSAKKYRQQFIGHMSNDLNVPQALGLAWRVAKDKKLRPEEKYGLLLDFDFVLGLNLAETRTLPAAPVAIKRLVVQREKLRQRKQWAAADKIRKEINKLGWQVEDTVAGPKIKLVKTQSD